MKTRAIVSQEMAAEVRALDLAGDWIDAAEHALHDRVRDRALLGGLRRGLDGLAVGKLLLLDVDCVFPGILDDRPGPVVEEHLRGENRLLEGFRPLDEPLRLVFAQLVHGIAVVIEHGDHIFRLEVEDRLHGHRDGTLRRNVTRFDVDCLTRRLRQRGEGDAEDVGQTVVFLCVHIHIIPRPSSCSS